MEWIIYPAAVLIVIVVAGVIMARRNAASKAVVVGERDAQGEPIGSLDAGLHQSTTALPERPAGPGAHI